MFVHPRFAPIARLLVVSLSMILPAVAYGDARLAAGDGVIGAVEEQGSTDFVYDSGGGTTRFVVDDGAGDCPADPMLTVLDADGARVGFDDDGGVGLCPTLEVELPVGRYTVRVQGYGGRAVEGFVLRAEVPDGPIDCATAADGAALCEGDRLHQCVDGVRYTVQCSLGARCVTDADGWSACRVPGAADLLSADGAILTDPLVIDGLGLPADAARAGLEQASPVLAELDGLTDAVLAGDEDALDRFIAVLDDEAARVLDGAMGEAALELPADDALAGPVLAAPAPVVPDVAAAGMAMADCGPILVGPVGPLDDLEPLVDWSGLDDFDGVEDMMVADDPMLAEDAMLAEGGFFVEGADLPEDGVSVAGATPGETPLFTSLDVLSRDRIATLGAALGVAALEAPAGDAQRRMAVRHALERTARLQVARDLIARDIGGAAGAPGWAAAMMAPSQVRDWRCNPYGGPVGGFGGFGGFDGPFDEPFGEPFDHRLVPHPIERGIAEDARVIDRFGCVMQPRPVTGGVSRPRYVIDAVSGAGGRTTGFCGGQDALVITGSGFNPRFGHRGHVEVTQADGRVVDLPVVSWTPTRIEVTLPADVRDGTLRLKIVEEHALLCGKLRTISRSGNAVSLDVLNLSAGIEATHADVFSIIEGTGGPSVQDDRATITWQTTDADTVTVTRLRFDGDRVAIGNAAAGQTTLRASGALDGTHEFTVEAFNRCGQQRETVTVDVVHGVKPRITAFSIAGTALHVGDVGSTATVSWAVQDAAELYLRSYRYGPSRQSAGMVAVTGRQRHTVTIAENLDFDLYAIGRIRKNRELVVAVRGNSALRTRPRIHSAGFDSGSAVAYRASRRLSWNTSGGAVAVRAIAGASVSSGSNRPRMGSTTVSATSSAASSLTVEVSVTNALLPAGHPDRVVTQRRSLAYRATVASASITSRAFRFVYDGGAVYRQNQPSGQNITLAYAPSGHAQLFDVDARAHNGRVEVCYSTSRLAQCARSNRTLPALSVGRTVYVTVTAYNGAVAGASWQGTVRYAAPERVWHFCQTPRNADGSLSTMGGSTVSQVARSQTDAEDLVRRRSPYQNYRLVTGRCPSSF